MFDIHFRPRMTDGTRFVAIVDQITRPEARGNGDQTRYCDRYLGGIPPSAFLVHDRERRSGCLQPGAGPEKQPRADRPADRIICTCRLAGVLW